MTIQFLTESEVLELTRISLKTLRRWRLENRGPEFRKFGSLVRYAEEDLSHCKIISRPADQRFPEKLPKQLTRDPGCGSRCSSHIAGIGCLSEFVLNLQS